MVTVPEAWKPELGAPEAETRVDEASEQACGDVGFFCASLS